MTIQIDSREKAHIIKHIQDAFDKSGVKHFVSKLPVGDYMSLDRPRLAIDRKHNLSELCCNVVQDHKRFSGELKRANELGIKLIVLVEHGRSVKKLDDVIQWTNPRLRVSPLAVSGERLYKILSSMRDKYGVEILFCDKRNTGKRIIEILEAAEDGE